ncbi:copper oxidase [Microvirga aerophila]|uniref:Copper oxidase n=2 Tax=Microvirga aerophila TaxID=670291 RepID=A0A512BNS4_9HYPH|nr:multicopper oxidase family protein [Microvirga aerophila]GEO13606.1 copper oxidase [Microvirga aerophila]
MKESNQTWPFTFKPVRHDAILIPEKGSFMITRRAAIAGLATTLTSLPRSGFAQAPQPQDAGKGLSGNGLTPTWTAKAAPRRLRPDASQDAELWCFNGEISPTLRLKQGVELRLNVRNETPKPISLHFHGVRGPNAMDGVGGLTQDPVQPGQTFQYALTPPDAGTYIIRPGIPGGSAEPLERGLTGLLIVEEPNPPQVDQDVALMIDDWSLNEDGSLAPFDASSGANPAGRLGNWLSVNGKATPHRVEAPQGGRVRLRLANVCNARIMRLRFDGLKPYVIGIDGQPTDTFEPLKASLPFPPGTRYDLLVDLPAEAGAKGAIQALIGNGIPLVDLVTTDQKRPALPAIKPLEPNKRLPDVIKLQNAARKDLVIKDASKDGKAAWTVNGAAGALTSAPLLKVKRGSPVVLALVNQTPFAQPMHLHGHVFRLLHPLDDGWEPYFLDTVQVPENKTVRIAVVADNPGKWLLASTVMERFDSGLWTWIEVT